MIEITTPARAGLIGNPSDGFFGKTLSIPVRNFSAKVVIFEWERIEILPGPNDTDIFNSVDALLTDIKINGYYGGLRLIKAGIKQFFDYVSENNVDIADKKFTLRYTSTIPRQIGLAGSSAIVTATMKSLCQFFGVEMDKAIMANHVLWAESKELGIAAGLQDRVVQVYDEPVYMDFDKDYMQENGYGKYDPVGKDLFPPMYLAYQVNLTHKDVVHNDVRQRWEIGDQNVITTMEKIADNAAIGFDALKNQDLETFQACMNYNFDLRASIYPIAEKNMEMIQLARNIGATSTFPGSGGAIIGTYDGDTMFDELEREFLKIDCNIIKIMI
ncbi:MAG TPA: GHMP kinase [Candidatus Lokiarchaeia archaeon]|nr:GHMP kinase [Candidatus Lokiarchaeia archaeon]